MAGAGTQSHGDGYGYGTDAADDFEFCILSSGALAQAGGKGAETAMCVADEVFSNGKLLPLRRSSAAGSDGPASAAGGGFGSRSDSRSASSSGSSSGCVSRSQSSNGAASSDHARRSLPSSLFYAHPSPSPQLRRWARPRRSTGSAPPPASWTSVLRLGVVGAPDVYYPPRTSGGEAKNAAAAAVARGGGSSRSARFEQASAAATAVDKKIGSGLFGDRLGCKQCSPDAIEPARLLPAPAKQQSRKKDDGGVKVRPRSRILLWLDELSITTKEK